jgi:predicted transcriptional regulator
MKNYQPTSRDAWRDFLPASASLDRAIMEAINDAGDDGLTCQEIEEKIGRSHQAVSGNLRHLVEKGVAKHGGAYGKTTSGRRAMKWVVNH